MLFAAAACDLQIYSERDEFSVTVSGMRGTGFVGEWERPYVMLAGSRMCVEEVNCHVCPDGEFPCDAGELELSGPLEPDGDDCYVATAPGEVTWSVSDCGTGDALRIRVVAPADVEPVARHELDAFVRAGGDQDIASVEQLGAPWLGDVAWPLRLVAESTASLPLDLRERDGGHPVAFEDGALTVAWETVRGRPPVAYPTASVAPVVFAGGEYVASLRFGDYTWPLGQVLGVAPDAVASLEIAAALAYEEDPNAPLLGRTSAPFLAHAIARDAEGNLVLGLPVVWTLDRGQLGVWTDAVGPTMSEYIWFHDECIAPEERGGPHEAVLRATGGGLSATVTLRWYGKDAPAESDWRPPDTCLAATEAGCGCRTDAPAGGGLLLLGLLALRRRRRVPKGMFVGTCLMGLSLAACAEPDPPAVRAAQSLELGVLPITDGGGNGASVAVGDRVVWLFYQDRSADLVEWPSSIGEPWPASAAVSADLDARDGLHPFTTVRGGSDAPLLALDDDEEAFNDENGNGVCGETALCERLALRPGPIVHDDERARLLLFYSKWNVDLLDGGARPLGSSIAVWRDDLGGWPTRPVVAEGAAEPRLLFADPGLRVVAAALVEDGELYAFACDGAEHTCRLARAPLALALERDAWSFYGGDDEWSASVATAEVMFAAAPEMSVHYSARAGVYIAAYVPPGSTSVVVRTAPRLEGPWSGDAEIHQVWRPVRGTTIAGAKFHPELAQDGGAVDYLTYHHVDADALQLVEIRWQ